MNEGFALVRALSQIDLGITIDENMVLLFLPIGSIDSSRRPKIVY